MSFSSREVIDEIRNRIDLADFIGARVPLKKNGATYKGCCPFHDEKTPSFTVSPEKGYYKCFGCGKSGDIFTFMQEFDGVPFEEALKKLAAIAGVPLESNRIDANSALRQKLYKIHAELAAFYQRCLLQTKEANHAREYLKSRNLSDKIVEQFGIGYAPTRYNAIIEWANRKNYSLDELVTAGILSPPKREYNDSSYYDRFRGRIMFPIYDLQGHIIAFSGRILDASKHPAKYVNSPETEVFKKSKVLYALNFARSAITQATPRQAIVCEGQIDVIRCHSAGFTTAVASQGTAFTIEHVELLKKSADCAILVFDSDSAGQKAAIRTSSLFFSAGLPCRIAKLPEGEDPDSLIREKGPDAFTNCLIDAVSPARFQIDFLRNKEKDPDAIDSIQRISQALIETIAPCPEPILTAAFIQEASKILALPITAFEQNLEKKRTEIQEAENRREKYNKTQNELFQNTANDSEDFLEPSDWSSEDYTSDAVENLDSIPLTDEERFQRPKINIEAQSQLNQSLSEILVHHFAEASVIELLIKHLPPAFVTQPYTSRLLTLAINAYITHSMSLGTFSDDSEFSKFVVNILSRNSTLEYALEATPQSAVQDIIKKYWIIELSRKRDELSITANLSDRLRLTASIKRLQTLPWNQIEQYLNAEKFDEIFDVVRPSDPKTENKPEKSDIAKKLQPNPESKSEIEESQPEIIDDEDTAESFLPYDFI